MKQPNLKTVLDSDNPEQILHSLSPRQLSKLTTGFLKRHNPKQSWAVNRGDLSLPRVRKHIEIPLSRLRSVPPKHGFAHYASTQRGLIAACEQILAEACRAAKTALQMRGIRRFDDLLPLE